jgi:hypothetical protein
MLPSCVCHDKYVFVSVVSQCLPIKKVHSVFDWSQAYFVFLPSSPLPAPHRFKYPRVQPSTLCCLITADKPEISIPPPPRPAPQFPLASVVIREAVYVLLEKLRGTSCVISIMAVACVHLVRDQQ